MATDANVTQIDGKDVKRIPYISLAGLPADAPIPASETNTVRLKIAIQGFNRDLLDPDESPPGTYLLQVVAENDTGADRTSNLSSGGTPTRRGLGDFYIDYTIGQNHATEVITFSVFGTFDGVQYGELATMSVGMTALTVTQLLAGLGSIIILPPNQNVQGTFNIFRHETWSVPNQLLKTDLTGWKKLWLTVKEPQDLSKDADTDAFIQLEATAPSSSKLTYINKTATTGANEGNGQLVVNDATTGDVSFSVESQEIVKIAGTSGSRRNRRFTAGFRWQDANDKLWIIGTAINTILWDTETAT